MKFHLLTIFPDFFQGPFGHGVVARAARAGLVEILVHDLRAWTKDFHKTVDDRPFGGGEGMVMKPEPVFDAVTAIWPERDPARQRIALLSAQGPLFDQRAAHRLSRYDEILLICGRYEGVDERVSEHLADEEISIGEFVISGGELAAAVVVDSVGRLMPGVLGNEESSRRESFSDSGSVPGLLDCPHYTRPADFRGWRVPEVLLGGNHAAIEKWRREAALEKTRRQRPDLLARVAGMPGSGGRALESAIKKDGTEV
jgi:tRNA (guanine37-N1)-methyltransferase